MIYFVGIIISFFLAVILISKKDKSRADKVLATWLFFIGLHLVLFYLFDSNKYTRFPYLLGVELPLPLIHGPFLYLYCAALTQQHYKKHLSGLHFLPLIAVYLLFYQFFLLPFPAKIKVYQNGGGDYIALLAVLYFLFVASGIVYIILSLWVLAKHKKNIAHQFSYTEKINLAWLRYLVLGIVVIWLAIIFTNDTYVFTAVVLYILFIGYFGIKQVGIFTLNMPTVEGEAPTDNTIDDYPAALPKDTKTDSEKYTKSGLDEVSSAAIHAQLTKAIHSQKWHKNPELTLGKLAQELEVQPNQLSQVINTIEQKNFYDYINGLRVQEFKQIVMQPQNQKFTLLALAYECGFNSKASFNRNFKKVTGLSPTDYLKKVNIHLSEKIKAA